MSNLYVGFGCSPNFTIKRIFKFMTYKWEVQLAKTLDLRHHCFLQNTCIKNQEYSRCLTFYVFGSLVAFAFDSLYGLTWITLSYLSHFDRNIQRFFCPNMSFLSGPLEAKYTVWVFLITKAGQMSVIVYFHVVLTLMDSCSIDKTISHLLVVIYCTQLWFILH